MNEDIIKKLKIGYYIDLLIRHRWLIMMIFCVSIVIGIFFSITRPMIYQATTFIKVIPRSVPEDYVPSVIEEDVGERINTISLEIKSRTNIENVIKECKLFIEPKYKDMYDEDKIASVRRNISVSVTKSRKGVDSFTLSYQGDNPEKVMDVVNSLAKSFIDESVKVMGDEVRGTKDFLESELNDKGERLDEKHEGIKKYREEHLGELPEQLDSNLKNLQRLQEKQISKSEGLRDAKDTLIQLEKDMTEVLKEQNKLEKKLAEIQERQNRMTGTETEIKVTPESEDQLKLKELQQQYIVFASKYTDKHPEMIRLKDFIEQLKIKIEEAEEKNIKTAVSDSSKIITEQLSAESLQIKELEDDIIEIRKQYAELEKQRNELVRDIQLYQTDIQNIMKQIALYEQWVENTPKVELKIKALERDLKPIQRSYDSLLEKREDAVIAVKMEKEQKGQKFRIIDVAKKPEKPISPNMKKLFAIFLGAGLVIGVGITVLSDFLDTSVRRTEDIEKNLGVPLLVTIPKIYQPKEKLMKKIRIILTFLYLMITFMLVVEFAMLSFLGLNTTLRYMKKIASFLPI